ncbi:MAG: molecular chaperone HtpG [Archangium sp.]|nr:molecular chaperone HtpG [Archangium sp.]MDP3569155.1 molecular chaperone HtpG [Archangium sp.]
MTTDTTQQTLSFQAEVKQLLHLMIHSLYSNREIFLRELISNASDACDKLRFESLGDSALLEGGGDLQIRIAFDREARTLTIADNGIGMNREEAVSNLGTIARSGTKDFFSKLTGDQQKDANLIGQFGVGFYSAFIVADRVTVRTRRAGEKADQGVEWSSDGEGQFSVAALERPERGTEITLHLREGQDDLLSDWKLESIIHKYADHVVQPIVMGDRTINQASALWARPKSDLTDDDYKAFYKYLSHDQEEPLAWVHAKVEGTKDYTQLLYVPSHAPLDLHDRNARHGVKLYVRRVFIMDDAEQLLPPWLRFVRGVVDSADLPLNVSRELLQQNKDIETLRKGCTTRVLALLASLAETEQEKYSKFWTEFGLVLKEGVIDFSSKDKLSKLLRFASTHTDQPEENVSLADYVARMKPEQQQIFFVTAETFNAAKNSPHLEVFRKKGLEVLLLSDRVDEWVVAQLTEFEGKALVSVAKGDLDLGKLEDEAEKKQQEEEASHLKELTEKIARSLGDRVKQVRITHRLTQSPACLVADEHDVSGNMARILKAAGQKAPDVKPILEINPKHPVVLRLQNEAARFDDWSLVLFDQALLAEGGQLDDPALFVRRINELMLSPS